MPARRPGGKAVSRKARQRYVPRTPRRASETPAPEPVEDVVDAVDPAAPIEAPAPPVATHSASAPSRRRTAPVAVLSTGSGLSARERADYHYVERDLRNIGILSLVMLGLLIGAWLLFNALGLVG